MDPMTMPSCELLQQAGGSTHSLAYSDGNPSGAAAQHQAADSKNYQSKLLKQINSMKNKEDLLSFVERCHYMLDSINLVTSMYRLARMFSSLQLAQEQRAAWKQDLLMQPCFTMLLSAIHQHLTQAQATLAANPDSSAAMTGMNARCLSNLIWSLVKLESVAEDGHPLAMEVVAAASPLVLLCLDDCSGQGLANLLWSYAKISTPYPEVMTSIVLRMVNLLQDPNTSHQLDAQALSNSIWAIAHIRSLPPGNPFAELDSSSLWQSGVTHFLLLLANQCSTMLSQLVDNLQVPRVQPQVVDNDQTFSCQALVNIVWSFSAILGSACGEQDPVKPLFLFVRELMVGKLKASTGGLQLHQPWVYSLSGTFNEQSLVSLVLAYEKAGLLNTPLLQAALDVASQRLTRSPMLGPQSPLPFKPQELCVLLRVCCTGLADCAPFVTALNRLLAQQPACTQGWTEAEAKEVAQVMQQVQLHCGDALQQQPQLQQQQQPQQQQQQVGVLPQQQQAQQVQQRVMVQDLSQQRFQQLQQPQYRQQMSSVLQRSQKPVQHRLANFVQRHQQQQQQQQQLLSMLQPMQGQQMQLQQQQQQQRYMQLGTKQQGYEANPGYVTFMDPSPRTASPLPLSGSSEASASLHLIHHSGSHASSLQPQLSASSLPLLAAPPQPQLPQTLLMRPQVQPLQLQQQLSSSTASEPSPVQQVLQLTGSDLSQQVLPSYELYTLASGPNPRQFSGSSSASQVSFSSSSRFVSDSHNLASAAAGGNVLVSLQGQQLPAGNHVGQVTVNSQGQWVIDTNQLAMQPMQPMQHRLLSSPALLQGQHPNLAAAFTVPNNTVAAPMSEQVLLASLPLANLKLN